MTQFLVQLQPSISLGSLCQSFQFSSSLSFLHSHSIKFRPISSKMSSASSILRQSITLPCQLEQPVEIVDAPGVSDSDFRNAMDSSLFKQWLMNLQSETGILANGAMSLKRVLIQVPGIVFARGPAVAVLILLDPGDQTYVVLTEQVRIPVGKLILELPAGMLDDDKGDFVGTAVPEVEEEIGIQLKLEDMVELTGFLDPLTECRVFPSPGGCDEGLGLLLYSGLASKETTRKRNWP